MEKLSAMEYVHLALAFVEPAMLSDSFFAAYTNDIPRHPPDSQCSICTKIYECMQACRTIYHKLTQSSTKTTHGHGGSGGGQGQGTTGNAPKPDTKIVNHVRTIGTLTLDELADFGSSLLSLLLLFNSHDNKKKIPSCLAFNTCYILNKYAFDSSQAHYSGAVFVGERLMSLLMLSHVLWIMANNKLKDDLERYKLLVAAIWCVELASNYSDNSNAIAVFSTAFSKAWASFMRIHLQMIIARRIVNNENFSSIQRAQNIAACCMAIVIWCNESLNLPAFKMAGRNEVYDYLSRVGVVNNALAHYVCSANTTYDVGTRTAYARKACEILNNSRSIFLLRLFETRNVVDKLYDVFTIGLAELEQKNSAEGLEEPTTLALPRPTECRAVLRDIKFSLQQLQVLLPSANYVRLPSFTSNNATDQSTTDLQYNLRDDTPTSSTAANGMQNVLSMQITRQMIFDKVANRPLLIRCLRNMAIPISLIEKRAADTMQAATAVRHAQLTQLRAECIQYLTTIHSDITGFLDVQQQKRYATRNDMVLALLEANELVAQLDNRLTKLTTIIDTPYAGIILNQQMVELCRDLLKPFYSQIADDRLLAIVASTRPDNLLEDFHSLISDIMTARVFCRNFKTVLDSLL